MCNYVSDDWLNGEELLGDKIALVRKNVSLQSLKQADFPCELVVHLVYEDIQDDGLPGSTEELELLGQNEELIAKHFCGQYGAKFALCVTSDGVRDLFLYLSAALEEEAISVDLESLSLSVDYDFGIRKVSDWEIYSYTLSKPGSATQSDERPWWKKLFGAG